MLKGARNLPAAGYVDRPVFYQCLLSFPFCQALRVPEDGVRKSLTSKVNSKADINNEVLYFPVTQSTTCKPVYTYRTIDAKVFVGDSSPQIKKKIEGVCPLTSVVLIVGSCEWWYFESFTGQTSVSFQAFNFTDGTKTFAPLPIHYAFRSNYCVGVFLWRFRFWSSRFTPSTPQRAHITFCRCGWSSFIKVAVQIVQCSFRVNVDCGNGLLLVWCISLYPFKEGRSH